MLFTFFLMSSSPLVCAGRSFNSDAFTNKQPKREKKHPQSVTQNNKSSFKYHPSSRCSQQLECSVVSCAAACKNKAAFPRWTGFTVSSWIFCLLLCTHFLTSEPENSVRYVTKHYHYFLSNNKHCCRIRMEEERGRLMPGTVCCTTQNKSNFNDLECICVTKIFEYFPHVNVLSTSDEAAKHFLCLVSHTLLTWIQTKPSYRCQVKSRSSGFGAILVWNFNYCEPNWRHHLLSTNINHLDPFLEGHRLW